MSIDRNDLLYIVAAIFLAGGVAIAVSLPDVRIGLFSMGGLLVIGLVMAIFVKPSLGADVLIITVFTNISNAFTERGLPSINKPLVAIVAVAILARYLYAARMPAGRAKTKGIETFLFLYLVVVALSYLSADDKGRSIEAILDLGKDIVIIYCILFVLRRPETWSQSAWVVILVTGGVCLLGGYQALTGNYDQQFFGLAGVFQDVGEYSTTSRIAGPIREPNIWGQVVTAVVPLVIFRIIYERRMRMKLLAVAILGILLFEILNTYSRGAYLALAVIVLLVLLGQRLHPIGWVGLIAAAALAFPYLPASYTERFQTLSLLAPTSQSGVYQESSFRGRASKMLTGLNMFAKNPILGVGAANYPNNYQKYTADLGLELRSGEQEPHSLYVQILAETGALGGITFAGFAALLLTNLSRAKRSIKHLAAYQNWGSYISAIQLSVISYLLSSFFLHGGYPRFFWIFVALALSAVQLTEELVTDPDRTHSLELPV